MFNLLEKPLEQWVDVQLNFKKWRINVSNVYHKLLKQKYLMLFNNLLLL